MPAAQTALAPTALIVGCGFVGKLLASKLVQRGVRVLGVVRGEASANELAALGVEPLRASVTDRDALTAVLKRVVGVDMLDVYYLVPPGRPDANDATLPRRTVLDGPSHLYAALEGTRVRRVAAASSTAVYGQTEGEHVDADTPAVAGDERGQLLLDGEHAWRETGLPVHIVRFAGLYGPGRIIGMQAVRGGAPLVGDPGAWLNLIHGDDAADLMIAMMTAKSPGGVELGSDGSPVTRIDYYTTLARSLGVPPPRVLDPAAAAAHLNLPAAKLPRSTSKRCDNVITCRRTGWLPRHPHFLSGLRASFAAMSKE